MSSVSTAPPGTRGPKRGQNPHPMTPERVALFLRAYRESGGNFAEAARVACPGAKDGVVKPCYSSFQKLRKRDIGFAAACDEILGEVADMIEAEIDRRGRIGWLDPIVQKGEHVTDAEGKPMFIRRFDSKLLLARARAIMPDKYGEKKTIDITHHKGSHGMMVVEGSDIPALSIEQRENLGSIMATIRAARDGVKAIEHKPGVTLDIPVVEVEPVAVEVVTAVVDATGEDVFPPWED